MEVRLPHECSCTKYYECEDGEQVVRNCPNGKYFDNRLKRCRPADGAAERGHRQMPRGRH